MANLGSHVSSLADENGQTSRGNKSDKGKEIDLYTQLWLACAGSLVNIPQAGDKVFYFPQGHIEQVEAYMNRDSNFEMPIYNLPSKILCKVVHVQLKAEANTDEVFAQITLLPESEEASPEGSTFTSKPRKIFSRSFSKTLTPSDTSTHGGFSIPKRHADECFPPLDMDQEPPTQELVAKDLNGSEWLFRHIYRGQPRRNLITSGWSVFVGAKRLVAGDTVIFLRGEKNRELHIGIRRARKPENVASASFISSLSMQHGILATAFHAMSTGSMFTVYYRPWTSPGEFLVPYDQYMKSAEIGYSLGMRFRMQFEVEDFPEYKCIKSSGTIIGIEDVDHIRWPDSDWRRLKVQWNGPSDVPSLPARVSPWSIELSFRSKRKQIPVTPNLKRSRPFDPLTANFPFRVKNTHQSGSEVLQGQETRAVDENPPKRLLTNFCAPEFASYLKNDEVRKRLAILDVNFISSGPDDSKPSAQTSNNPKCMLFGVDVLNGLPSSQETLSQSTVSEAIHISDPLNRISSDLPEQQCQNCCSIPKRSCTKVMKYGTTLGRSIDLACFDGYEELLSELDRMFEFEGTLSDGSSEWHVTYIDGEGDMMLLGDCPWPEFRAMVRKMFIYPTEDPDNLEPTS